MTRQPLLNGARAIQVMGLTGGVELWDEIRPLPRMRSTVKSASGLWKRQAAPLRLALVFPRTGGKPELIMNQQRIWVAFIAVGMCVHALILGRQLESVFGIAAFAWGWIAWTAIFNRLADAQTMALTMTVILIASSVALLAASNDSSAVVAHLSLALVPAIVAFMCVSYLIWDLQRPRHEDPVADWTAAIAAATPVGKVNARSPAPITVGALGDLKLPSEANDDGRPYGAEAAADNLSLNSDSGVRTRVA